MAHPMASSSEKMKSDKLHRMTRDYGSADPSSNVSAPTNRAKQEGPEDDVGFGAESNAPRARSDRASRKPKAPVMANPLATYANGGAVNRAAGGRTKHKGSTHVNVIVAPQGGGAAGAPPMPIGGPAGAPPSPPVMAPPHPPMVPPGAMGASGGLPPGPMPPAGGMPGLRAGGGRTYAKGGRVKREDGGPVGSVGEGQNAQQSSAMSDMVKRQQDMLNTPYPKGQPTNRAKGGKVGHYDDGAGSGEGRLEKIENYGKRAHEKPQAV